MCHSFYGSWRVVFNKAVQRIKINVDFILTRGADYMAIQPGKETGILLPLHDEFQPGLKYKPGCQI